MEKEFRVVAVLPGERPPTGKAPFDAAQAKRHREK
jgi:hypothetical protein